MKEHLDYYPTQVFSEYLRHIYRDKSGNAILGILYPSSVHKTGKSLVLFIEKDSICDKTPNLKNNPEKHLKLLTKLTETIDPRHPSRLQKIWDIICQGK